MLQQLSLYDLHPSVLGRPFLGVVRRHGTERPDAIRLELVPGDAVFGNELIHDSLGPLLRELHAGIEISHSGGMADHNKLLIGIGFQEISDSGQSFRGLRQDIRLVGVEMNIIDGDMARCGNIF